MELVKETKEFNIYKKRNGRYSVLDNTSKKYINGNPKVQVLVDEGLIKAAIPTKEAPVIKPVIKEEAPAVNKAPKKEESVENPEEAA